MSARTDRGAGQRPRETRPHERGTWERRASERGTWGALVLLGAMLVAAMLAFVSTAASAEPERPARVDAIPNDAAAFEGGTRTDAWGDGGDGGDTGPFLLDAGTLRRWLPPGSDADDPEPSLAIFPPQKITIRFDHKLHVQGQKLACTTCHQGATTSQASRDRLLPRGVACDGCHGTDHSNLDRVRGGAEATTPDARCATCHEGYRDGDGNRVARFELPAPNLVFDHKKHAARNIGCAQCHGEVREIGLATRQQLPRMRGCLGCHQHPDPAARGTAKGSCDTCHLTDGAGSKRLRTSFASGVLTPPSWMHGAAHTPDFLQRHKYVAGSDSAFCGDCHKEDECAACHDGRVRPRNIHPNDYLSMHAIEARMATQKCTSCHREQSFCLGCHQRLGVSMSGPGDVREAGRFHPPKSVWSDPPRNPGHHAFEAMRNLDACVSCHVERDCVACHGGRGVGAGFNPHTGGFLGGCATQLRRNPRPCYVCHEAGDPDLQRCQ